MSPVQFTRCISKAREKKILKIITYKQRNNWYKGITEQNKSKQNGKNDKNKIIQIRAGFYGWQGQSIEAHSQFSSRRCSSFSSLLPRRVDVGSHERKVGSWIPNRPKLSTDEIHSMVLQPWVLKVLSNQRVEIYWLGQCSIMCSSDSGCWMQKQQVGSVVLSIRWSLALVGSSRLHMDFQSKWG